MILRRLGNKKKLMPKLIPYFPDFKIWIEPFFGSGSAFFYLPHKPKYAIVNDLDSDVFNLFQVVMNQKEELEKAFYMMPIHSDLLEYWKKHEETDPIKKALRFLFLSNFTYLGKMDTLSFTAADRPKKVFYDNVNLCFNMLENIKFNNIDFRKFLSSLSFPLLDFGRPSTKKDESFIYNDSPYLNTVDTYNNSDKWGKKDVIDLFDANIKTGCRFAYSELNHPFILDQAKERNLNVIIIGERQNLKNRRTEILITNYENLQQKLF